MIQLVIFFYVKICYLLIQVKFTTSSFFFFQKLRLKLEPKIKSVFCHVIPRWDYKWFVRIDVARCNLRDSNKWCPIHRRDIRSSAGRGGLQQQPAPNGVELQNTTVLVLPSHFASGNVGVIVGTTVTTAGTPARSIVCSQRWFWINRIPLLYVIDRGARDYPPNAMYMDKQPQGQQAAPPVFQPQVQSLTETLSKLHVWWCLREVQNILSYRI